MTPSKSGDLEFSKLTVAALEDLGYGVDYTSDTIDLGYSRCCTSSRRNIRGLQGDSNRPKHKRPLSAKGREKAVAHGRALLASRALPEGVPREVDGIKYIGDQYVNVIIFEDGLIYDVDVTSD